MVMPSSFMSRCVNIWNIPGRSKAYVTSRSAANGSVTGMSSGPAPTSFRASRKFVCLIRGTMQEALGSSDFVFFLNKPNIVQVSLSFVDAAREKQQQTFQKLRLVNSFLLASRL